MIEYEEIKPGLYNIVEGSLQPVKFDIYGLVNPSHKSIIKKISKFILSKKLYDEYGFEHTRKYMIYGPPGTGKSNIIFNAINSNFLGNGSICNGFICIYIKSISEFKEFKELHFDGTTRFCFILEEFDYMIENDGYHEYMSYMNGDNKIKDSVWIMTTNHINNIPHNIKYRPSIIDEAFFVDYPNYDERKNFMTEKFGKDLSNIDLAKFADITDGLNYSQIKELIISTFILNTDFEDTISTMKSMNNKLDKQEY